MKNKLSCFICLMVLGGPMVSLFSEIVFAEEDSSIVQSSEVLSSDVIPVESSQVSVEESTSIEQEVTSQTVEESSSSLSKQESETSSSSQEKSLEEMTEEELLLYLKENTDYDQSGNYSWNLNARAGRNQGVAQFLGTTKNNILNELLKHEKDNFYLGTPFRGLASTDPARCMSPNGAPTWYGPGMNCTGFVATVMQRAGANLNKITNVANAWGGICNAYNWRDALGANVEYYAFNSVSQLLSSGKASKGDIIYFEPDTSQPGYDCHIGFFWGDRSNENKMWHTYDPNIISNIKSGSGFSKIFIFKLGENTPVITSTKTVNYPAKVVTKNDGLRTLPAGMKNSNLIALTSKYYGQDLDVIQEVTVSNGTKWYKVKQAGKELGYIDSVAFSKYSTITKRIAVNYPVKVVTTKDGLRSSPYGTQNSNLIDYTSKFYGQDLDVVEELTISNGRLWYKVKQNGLELGYIDSVALRKYSTITNRKAVSYPVKVMTKNDGLRSSPYGTKDSLLVSRTDKYFAQDLDVSEEVKVSNGTTWFKVSQKGQELGYIDSVALKKYSTITNRSTVDYGILVITNKDGIRTAPYDVQNSLLVSLTNKFYGQTLDVVEELKLSNGRLWYKVMKDNKELGYVDSVATRKCSVITKQLTVNYSVRVMTKKDGIRTMPYDVRNSNLVSLTDKYYGQSLDVIEEMTISNGRVWYKVLKDGVELGYVDSVAVRKHSVISSKKAINYPVKVVTKTDGLRTLPYDMKNSLLVSLTSQYFGQTLMAVEEVRISNGTVWYKVMKNDIELGYIDVVALKK